ncbi:acyloxyacyl hydrolase [Desulfosediminicola flagellatus]|uniref:acyloxyacyl hydrolase n=1 Tax=Desulfosediminicola flagellatus TaxID=2569541 RepID=UPI0010AD5FC9|nr:acyloxyacyl hydrolase [Desulfosediminicola flagellatus]
MKKYMLYIPVSLILLNPIDVIAEEVSQQNESTIISEVRVGLSKHDSKEKHEDGFDVNADLYFTSPSNSFFRAIYSPHPIIGVSLHSEGITHQLYAGLAWNIKPTENIFLTIMLGGGIHSGELESDDPDKLRLGSRALFRYAGSIGYRFSDSWNISVILDHMSNASLADSNNGLEKVGIQLGYIF